MHRESTDILRQKLRELPVYEPSGELWQKMDSELSLGEALDKLPGYVPSENNWWSIERKLKPETGAGSWLKPGGIAAAAVILVLFASNLWHKHTLTREEVIIMPLEMPAEESEDFERILALCSKKKEICERQDFKEIKNEYEHLQSAGEELRNALGPYSTDSYLMDELQKIERQKLQLLRELNQLI